MLWPDLQPENDINKKLKLTGTQHKDALLIIPAP